MDTTTKLKTSFAPATGSPNRAPNRTMSSVPWLRTQRVKAKNKPHSYSAYIAVIRDRALQNGSASCFKLHELYQNIQQ